MLDTMVKYNTTNADALMEAMAEAEAVKRIQEVMGGSEGTSTNYLVAMRYIDALKTMTSGDQRLAVASFMMGDGLASWLTLGSKTLPESLHRALLPD